MGRTVVAENNTHGGGHAAAAERTTEVVTPVSIAAVGHRLTRPRWQGAHHRGAGIPEINIGRSPTASVFVTDAIADNDRIHRNSFGGIVEGNFIGVGICHRVIRCWISFNPVGGVAADFKARIGDTGEGLLGFPQTGRGVFCHGGIEPVIRRTAKVGVSPGFRLHALRVGKHKQ